MEYSAQFRRSSLISRRAAIPRPLKSSASTRCAVGEVCANLGDLLRPDMIILGSLATHLGPNWVEFVRDRFRAEALPDTSACPIEPAGLGAIAGLLRPRGRGFG